MKVYLKYSGIWNKIKKLVSVKFHSQLIHDDKYIKTKVKTFGETSNTLFSNNKFPNKRSHYIWIAAICVDPVLKIVRKNSSSSVFRPVQMERKTKKIGRFYWR